MQILEIASFKVSGLTIRTNNHDEFKPESAKIGALWNDFFAQQLPQKLNVEQNGMFGVYSNYASDAHGDFDVTAAIGVGDPAENLSTVEIQAGKYLVFPCEGEMPEAVIQGWQRVWAYFQTNTTDRRRFVTDYESYLGPQQAAIHIGIE